MTTPCACVGIAKGIKATESARAALMRQGLQEMSQFCREFHDEGKFQVGTAVWHCLSLVYRVLCCCGTHSATRTILALGVALCCCSRCANIQSLSCLLPVS